MSLFSSLQMAGNTLQAMQIGLHVVGNNIANANTPGYVRERAVFAPAPVQEVGTLTLGLGVEVTGIVQNIDKFAEERLRDAGGDRASAELAESTYRDLEVLLNSLGESNVSAQLAGFFNSLSEINNGNTSDIAKINLAISAGEQLTQSITTLDREVNVLRDDLNTRVDQLADEINTLAEEIRQLNLRIVNIEGGGASGSDAGGLRSQRGVALKRLAEIVDLEANESDTGVVNISVNGQFLVFEGTRREVESQQTSTDGTVSNRIVFSTDSAELPATGGELGGIYESRDTILDDFLSGLDEFAGALAFEFNKVYSQGQGTEGFTSVTGTYRADDANAALDQAGLDFTPDNGEFNILVRNKNLDARVSPDTSTIQIDLIGDDGSPTTLTSLAEQLDAVSGITASVSIDNELVINSESPADIEFTFEEDTSGVLAALGINTFFTGADAGNIGVNAELTTGISAGAKFANDLRDSQTGGPIGGANALRLVDLQDKQLSDQDGKSIGGVYQELIDATTQGATTTASIADGLRTFEGTLEAAAASVSGVNLDEEAIDLIQLQRAYQASARYISTLSELLDILVNL
ncbi:MAG: flagellar hook-associated protein FlgK [Planctomycetota bacterium]